MIQPNYDGILHKKMLHHEAADIDGSDSIQYSQ